MLLVEIWILQQTHKIGLQIRINPVQIGPFLKVLKPDVFCYQNLWTSLLNWKARTYGMNCQYFEKLIDCDPDPPNRIRIGPRKVVKRLRQIIRGGQKQHFRYI